MLSIVVTYSITRWDGICFLCLTVRIVADLFGAPLLGVADLVGAPLLIVLELCGALRHALHNYF